MGRRALILAAGVGAGHNEAASAVEAALRSSGDADEVQRIDILETTNELFSKVYDEGYFTLVAQAPWLVGWGYDDQDAPFKSSPVVRWWEDLNTTSIMRQVKAFDPQVVISTHFLPARLMSLLAARRQLRATLAVVTTDYDFQGLWLTSPVSQYFVAREETTTYLSAMGLPKDRVVTSGIPVRPGLGDPVDAAAVRGRLGLDPELPIVLISAGAAGGSYTLNTVRQVRRSTQRFQAVVVCGHNDDLRAQVEALVARSQVKFRVLGYTTEMADLLRISSLYVGKPGGLSSSECMAAGLPMVLINPIPGQEVRNADFLVEDGAAVRCNYATTIGYKIDALLADPARLAAMAANAHRIGRADAARTIVDASLSASMPPLWISREAKKSMLAAAEEGIATSELQDDRRLLTLTDQETGGSRAVLTYAQLRELGVTTWSREVTLTRDGGLSSRLRADPQRLDLEVSAQWLLGDGGSRVYGLE